VSARKRENIASTFFKFADYSVILAENFELNAVGEWLPTFRRMVVLSPSRVRHLKKCWTALHLKNRALQSF
jgi:hypothetical protein